MPNAEEINERVNAIVDMFNRHDPAGVAELYAADVALTDTRGKTLTGRQNLVNALQDLFTAYPDATMETLLVIAPRPDTAVMEFMITGTHSGPLRVHEDSPVFAASERPVQWTGVDILTFDSAGKVQRSELRSNPAHVLAQIGAIAPPAAAAGMGSTPASQARARAEADTAAAPAADELRRRQDELEQAINRRDAAACAGCYEEGATLSAPGEPDVTGRQSIKAWYQMFFDGFPDLRHQAKDVLVDGSIMVVHWTGWGTHHGDLGPLPSSGRSVEIHGAIVNRFGPSGLIRQCTWYWDNLHFMQQLGHSPH